MTTLVSRKFYEYLLPTFLMSVSSSLAILLDSIIVSNLLGSTALAAVNLNNPIANMISAIVNIFAFGLNTVVAIYKGQLKDEEANKTFSIAMFLGVAITSLLLLICLLKIDYIAGFLSGWKSLELMNATKEYLFPLILSFPVLLIYIVISFVMRVDGFPKASAFILIFSNIMNLLISFTLIKFFHFGISGSAWGLFLGYFCGCLVLLYYAFSKDRTLSFKKFNFSDVKKLFPNVFFTGLPNGATNIFMLLRVFILNLFILKIFNTAGVAVFALCMTVIYFAYIFVRGSVNTMITIAGVLFGENDNNGIYHVMKTAFYTAFVLSLISFVIFAFSPNLIISIYGLKSVEEIELTTKALKAFSICVPFFCVNYMAMCYFQCIKRLGVSFLISMLNNFVLVVIFVLMLGNINQSYLWYGFPVAEIEMFLMILAYCFYVSKTQNLTFPLLLSKNTQQVLNITIDKNLEQVSVAYKKAMDFCKGMNIDEQTALKVGIVVEEISANVIENTKYKKNALDITLSIENEHVKIRFRDNDFKFDPTNFKNLETEENLYSGLEVVKLSISEWNYVRNIGFNTLIVKI